MKSPMRLLLPGQVPRLADWATRPFSAGTAQGPADRDLRLLCERVVAREAPGAPEVGGPHRRVAAAILRYEVVPPRVLRPVLARAPLEVGDTIGARYGLPLGFAIFFASRAVERFDGLEAGLWRTGFRYRTLDGHPELGEETFAIDKDVATGDVRVSLTSWSRPGLWVTWLAAPALRWVQARANAAALDHLQVIAAGS